MAGEKQPKDVKAAEAMAKVAEHMVKNKDKKFSWEDTKDKIVRYAGALIMEKNDDGEWVMSVGRVSWWLAFLPALYIFVASFVATQDITEATKIVERDITSNHFNVIMMLAAYNFGKKMTSAAKKMWGKNEGPG